MIKGFVFRLKIRSEADVNFLFLILIEDRYLLYILTNNTVVRISFNGMMYIQK